MHRISSQRIKVEPNVPSAPPLEHHPDAYLHRRLCALAHEHPLPTGAEVSLAQRIRAMVGRDGNINAPDDHHNTPLHVIAARTTNSERNVQVLARLLDEGAAINARNRDGCTPLHVAASGPDPRIATLLLSYGADRTAINNHLHSALALAQSVAMVDALIE